MKQIYTLFIFITAFITFSTSYAQTVFWFEDFDNNAAARWNVTGNHPTPAGIPGLVYGTNNNFDYFVINDANTPELSGLIANGLSMSAQGQFVQGHHYDCAAPNNLPNPFVNTGGVNRSLHITSQAGCSGLIYAGTPGYDDWNCLTISGNDFPLTQTEQYAAYNNNIDATGKCNIKLTADFFLGGSANGLEAHSTILYSIDGGVTWKIVQDNLSSCVHFIAGTCNNWNRRTFELPSDADNQPDLRIAFRWTEDANTNNNTQDYALGGSFNVDNVMLSACAKPNADFLASTNACKNQTIALNSFISISSGSYINCFNVLTDNCTITAYSWNITGPGAVTYVGGTNASHPNPQVQLSADGAYSVVLTASSCGGDTVVTKTNYITVADCPPVADFISSQSTACIAPVANLDTITFTDLSFTPSTPITAWSWTFSPATVTYRSGTTSASQNPQVTFNAAGIYEVTLQITTSEGVDTEIKTAYINAINCDCGGGGGGASIFWSENFDGNGGAGSRWDPTLNFNVGGVGNGANSNRFYSSNVGSGSDNDLHVSAAAGFGGDIGYFYVEFGFGGFTNTNKRSMSTSINTTGRTALTLNFVYIEQGFGSSDNAIVEYSINNGTTWITLQDMPKVGGTWTPRAIALPATCENITTLKIAFRWTNTDPGGGAVDPPFAVDDINIIGTSAGGPTHTWTGATNTDWHTITNWTAGTVPTNANDVLIPSGLTNMPTISAAAVAKNVCNYGTITLTGNNTLSINENLLNEGVVQTDNVNAAADVIFVTAPSTYRGNGTMYDVDVAVTSSNLTLESNLVTRSLIISTTGTVDLATFKLAINKNLTKTAGTFIATDAEIHFIDACGTCVDLTSNADVTMNAAQAFGNVFVIKSAGVKVSLLSNITHSFASPKTLNIESGIFDANTFTVSGTGNLTMTDGEYQTAKCATVVPELTGTYSLTGGKVTLDGVCNQTIRVDVGIAGGPVTVFSEDFENPNIANGAAIAGNIPVWTEAGTSGLMNFINNEASGLTSQTANVRVDWNFDPDQTETLVYGPINFGATTTNPQLTFDYESVDNSTIASVRIEVLYKSTFASPWTVGATYNHATTTAVFPANLVPLAGASSTFYIGFRITIFDTGLGADGEVSIDNIIVTADGVAFADITNYHDVEFTGTGIKSLDNGSLNIHNQLFLSLPTLVGNYVNTGADTCFVYNSDANAVIRTGGHIVGFLGRDIDPSNTYRYDVGSDNAGGDTYYEPITVTTNAIFGATNIAAKFFDVSPNPAVVSNVTFLTPAGVIDTIKTVETEGYWHLAPNSAVLGGNYRAMVSPSSFWTLSKPWQQDYYALLKQDAVAQPWDFINGGIRTNDSTTTAFSDFSNVALAFADTNLVVQPTVLPITLTRFEGEKIKQGNLLSWSTEMELDNDYFELERSAEGVHFNTIATVDALGNSIMTQHYQHLDTKPLIGWNYYRLKSIDINGHSEYSHLVALYNHRDDITLKLFPNPATDKITFDYIGADVSTIFVVEIIDIAGRKIWRQEYQLTDSRVWESINTKEFPAGVYMIQFTNGGVMESRKLVIIE